MFRVRRAVDAPGDTSRYGAHVALSDPRSNDPSWLPDVLVALVLAALVVVEVWVQPLFQTGLPGPRVAVTALALAATLPVAVRRDRPALAVGTTVVALLALGLVADARQSGFPLFLAVLLIAWSAASRCSAATAARLLAVLLVAGAVYQAMTFVAGKTAADVVVPLLLLTAAWTGGSEVRRSRDAAARVTEDGAQRAALEEQRRTRAVQDERDRIAREMHDIVGSALSVIGVQAAVAGGALHDGRLDAAVARDSVGAVERISRDAVLDMRRMLAVLRRPAGTSIESDEPLPGIERLGVLAADIRAAGVTVELTVDPAATMLPPALQLAVYRVVQEALTNTLKHAGRAQASVTVSYEPNELVLSIEDDGVGPAAEAAELGALGGRHGLVGMRERVALYGGLLQAGRRRGGGFAVRARLPTRALVPGAELSRKVPA